MTTQQTHGSDRNPLMALRNIEAYPTMGPEAALKVLSVEPAGRARIAQGEPGDLESYAVQNLPPKGQQECLTVACLARVMVNHKELPEVRTAAAEALVARNPALGMALVLVMAGHQHPEVSDLGRQLTEPLVGAAVQSTTPDRIARAISSVVSAGSPAERSLAFVKLGGLAQEQPEIIAATLAILCVEGLERADREEGIRLLCLQVPEAIPYFKNAA